jgi:hypothetical protein
LFPWYGPKPSSPEEKILDDIRFFLRRWPGTISSVLDSSKRFERLVRVIAGYPEIYEGTTPLDVPLEENSKRAFKLILALDERPPNWGDFSSLWTELLEMTTQFKKGKSHRRMTEELLAALFIGLGEPEPKAKGETPNFSRAAQSLLAELFSYTSGFGPRDGQRGLGSWHEVGRIMFSVESGSLDKPQYQKDRRQITVEFKRIKNWLHDINPYAHIGPSISQRYLRGGSSLLQIRLASIRTARFMSGMAANILIDGGGRIVVLTNTEPYNNVEHIHKVQFKHDDFRGPPPDDIAYNSQWELEDLTGSLPDPIFARIFPDEQMKLLRELYGHDPMDFWGILPAGESSIHMGEVANLSFSLGGENFDTFFDFLDSFMPLRIERSDPLIENISQNTPNTFDEFVEEKLAETIPVGTRPRIYPPWDPECPRCKGDEIVGSEQRLIEKREGGFCNAHRIIHEVGNKQRIRDSASSQPSYGSQPKFPESQREVKAVARIDGNSIGWLLNRTRFDESPIIIADQIRRRSMRFNSHWWVALSEAIAKQNWNYPDRIACWVSAGDDIVLALYGDGDEEPGKSIGSLKEMMVDFSENLNMNLNSELKAKEGGPLATFSGSISVRNPSGGKLEMSEMIENAEHLEIEAKREWKADHIESISEREMISPEKLERVGFGISQMLVDGEGWTREILREIANEQGLNIDDEGDLCKLDEICARAEIVSESGTQKILIPERNTANGECPDFERLIIPVDEGVSNLVLIQTIAEEE